ncbi:hypothetical protein [Candidatus Deferrimicrobium sp.]|uniref:hypothetical protein n=1 Tax=Candidatus Deferrimicrobium sp. TaxID=3060586 RepID=UPI002ED89324
MASETKVMDPKASNHRWRFFRAGGFDQVLLETGADLVSLGALDQKLWVALSCPVSGIEFDAKSLAFVDADADGHIRAPEILAAVRWAGKVLKDPDHLIRREDRLPLSAIDDGTEEGRAVLGGAMLVLSVLGESEATEITLDDVSDTARIFSQARFNGDGIVPAKSAENSALAAVIGDILGSLGGESDRGGDPGVTAEAIERFYTEAKAIADWWEAVGKPETHPFGDDTAALYELFRSLKPKVEDYFQRCRLAAYDGRSAALLGPAEADYQKLAATTLRGDTEAVAGFPLAVAAAGKALPLAEGLNPAYADAVRRFAAEIVLPVLGGADSLTDDGWGRLCARFAPYETWLETKPATTVEALGEERVRTILAEDGRTALLDLVARDKAVEPEVAAILSVERLLRYCRDLHLLVNNFVSFRDFYTRKGKATFQAGTLYLDGRSCDLCVSITDVGRHAAIATLSRVCLVYCDCERQGGAEKRTIAAAFTAGDSDFLTVGRNGVFYDRKGQDWDATIVRILEHPISVRQAFWAPYKRLARLIGDQMQKISAARSKAADDRAALRAISATQNMAAGKPVPPPPPPFDVAKFAGIFAAIGLAIGAIGTMLAAVLSGVLKLPWWQFPIVIAVIILVISIPSVILAWLKLRKRNIGPILDANGWAVNARARINIPFGTSLTAAARLPENAERSLADPFAEKKRPWKLYLVLATLLAAALVLWRQGYLAQWFGM